MQDRCSEKCQPKSIERGSLYLNTSFFGLLCMGLILILELLIFLWPHSLSLSRFLDRLIKHLIYGCCSAVVCQWWLIKWLPFVLRYAFQVITKATTEGTLFSKNWDLEPLFPLPSGDSTNTKYAIVFVKNIWLISS